MDLFNLVLGGGGVAFLGAVVKVIQSIRNSTDQRRAKALQDMEDWRDERAREAQAARADADYQRTLTGFWQARAGHMEFMATQAGAVIPPLPDPPPRPTLIQEPTP